eukprot:scaffold59863_cov58-Attheya_sp.AAC.3
MSWVESQESTSQWKRLWNMPLVATRKCDHLLIEQDVLDQQNKLVTIMHFTNQTLIDWYSCKQATIETAMYGSEFVAARTATDQIMHLRLTLRYGTDPRYQLHVW